MEKKNFYIAATLFLGIVIFTFSPVVIPSGESGPWLFGMPRTLWMGIGISFCLAFLTLWAALNIKEEKRGES